MSTVEGEQTGAGSVMMTTGGPVTMLISKLAEGDDVHPAEFVIVKLYTPEAMLVTIFDVPVPVVTTLPGERVRVHVPAGKPFTATVPNGESYLGCVMSPIKGADGVTG
jgi:hypothetical protein